MYKNRSLGATDQTSNAGTDDFFPGHASLAYFFFLGSNELSALAVAGSTVAGVTGTTGGAISTSGAGFGILKPSLEAVDVENSDKELTPVESVCFSGPETIIAFVT